MIEEYYKHNDESVKLPDPLIGANTADPLTISPNDSYFQSFYALQPSITFGNVPPFKFNEPNLITEALEYIKNTYGQHYSKEDGIQAIELIFSRPERGEHFCISNILKLADRYGFKDGKNRKDLLKIIHYAVLAMYLQDKNNNKV